MYKANSTFRKYDYPNETYFRNLVQYTTSAFSICAPQVQFGVTWDNCNRIFIRICKENTRQRCSLLNPALGVALHLNFYLFCSSYKALRHLIICFKRLTTAGARAWRRIPGNDIKTTLNAFTVSIVPKEFVVERTYLSKEQFMREQFRIFNQNELILKL
jgi:hypothetical protein